MRILLLLMLFFLLQQSFAQTTNGLTAHYSFNDGTGTDSQGGNTAQFVGGVSLVEDRFGNQAKAAKVDGNLNTYIDLGNSNALKPITGTISLWVNVEDISTDGRGIPFNPIIVAKNPNSPDSYMEAYSMYVHMKSKQGLVNFIGLPQEQRFFEATDDPMNFGEWYHFLITYDNDFVTSYINGIQTEQVLTGFNLSFSNDNVILGNTLNPTNNRAFKGILDDIRIYNRVLTAAEIQGLYQAPDPNNSPTAANNKPNCAASLVLKDPNNSSIDIVNETTVKKVSHKGNNTVETKNELEAGETGWIKFKIKEFGTDQNGKDGEIQAGATINGIDYHFVLTPNKLNHNIVEDGSILNTFSATFSQNDLIEVNRTNNKLILKQKISSGQMQTIAEIPNIGQGNTKFYITMSGLAAKIKNAKMSFSLGCPSPNYAKLKNEPSAGYFDLSENFLRFQFEQEYAVSNNTFESITYKIYNWKRETPIIGSFNAEYGINWIDIDISSLTNGEPYILEFEANKEERYYLNFKKN